MRIRPRSYVFLVAVTAAALLAAGLAGSRLIGQTASSGSTAAPTLKTPWGAPDLQGTWSNTTVVPFERPKGFGEREFLTDAEHEKAVQELLKRDALPGRDSRESNGKDIRGTEKDVARAYNEHWFGDKPTEVGRRTSMIIDPPDGRMPALTPEARERINKKREYLQALLQGTSGGKPGPISPRRNEPSTDYNLDRINRADGQGSGFNRAIPITNRLHLPKEIHQYWGDSIARWEGDTLVVDVTNFSQETEFRGSRENLHLIERYKRIDPRTLQITITAEDTTTWVKPFTFVQELRKNADKPNMVYEGGC